MFDLEDRRADIERHRENSARQAQAFAKFESIGVGSMEYEERVDFGLTFIEEPFVAFSSALDLDDVAEVLDLNPEVQTPIPLVSGMVTEWDRDDRDFYVGAWVAVQVYFLGGEDVGELAMTHYFTFQAIAMKDVPLDVRD